MSRFQQMLCVFCMVALVSVFQAHADSRAAQEKSAGAEWLEQWRAHWQASLALGYLKQAAPDSLAISPPPPESGSLWAQLDEVIAGQALSLRGSARFEQARHDAEMYFPGSAQHFSCALGIPIDERHTPTLYRMMQRTQVDAGHYAVSHAKAYYRRTRPFMVNGEPTCTPEQEDGLRLNGSYPSGHASIGWTWALMLAEIAPDRATGLIRRGRSYGHSRVVCNVHWYSDVVQGQALAASLAAVLNAHPEFSRDVMKAREEVMRARSLDLPLPHDCSAEEQALEQELSQAR